MKARGLCGSIYREPHILKQEGRWYRKLGLGPNCEINRARKKTVYMAPIKSSILKSRPLGKGWGPRDVAVRQECWVDMLQEEEALPGTKSRLLCSTWKWIIQGDTCSEKARDFTGKGCSGGKQRGEGDWKDSSAMWLAVPGFMVMGFVSGSSLANQPDSRSFLVVLHCSANQKDSGRLVGPKDRCLLLIFLEFFWLVVAC